VNDPLELGSVRDFRWINHSRGYAGFAIVREDRDIRSFIPVPVIFRVHENRLSRVNDLPGNFERHSVFVSAILRCPGFAIIGYYDGLGIFE
jgi:hypothetical protein